MPERRVVVSWERLPGWLDRYEARHPGTVWEVSPARVTASSADGTRAGFDVPLPPLTGSTLGDLADHLQRPWRSGLLLVRRGGYAVARLTAADIEDVKIGRRHVQGRSRAGGWSQQRFARRRSNQAQAAFDAASEHAERILLAGDGELNVLATGGDRHAIGAVLNKPALRRLREVDRQELSVSGDPNREALTRAIQELRSVSIELVDPPAGSNAGDQASLGQPRPP